MNSKTFIFLAAVLFSIVTNAADNEHWILDASTENGLFVLSLQPKEGKPVIGEYHDWVIEVTDENEQGIEEATFRFGGGMAAHGHGLPSQPVVTQYLGDGKYLIEGMLFNMAGDWSLVVAVKKDNFTDQAVFDITLDF